MFKHDELFFCITFKSLINFTAHGIIETYQNVKYRLSTVNVKTLKHAFQLDLLL